MYDIFLHLDSFWQKSLGSLPQTPNGGAYTTPPYPVTVGATP